MNKKGIFMPVLVIFTLIVYSWAFYVIVINSIEKADEKIGENQIRLYGQYNEAEKMLLFVDEAAKQAGYDTILELGENGGYMLGEISDCGKVVGYNIWYGKMEECYPTKLNDRFSNSFRINFDEYLMDYEAILFNDIGVNGLRDFHEIRMNSGDSIEIFGVSKEKYVLGLKYNEDFDVLYAIEPHFKTAIDYDFADYNELKLIMVDAVRLCNTAKCFDRNVDKKDYGWNILDRDQYVVFDVNTGRKVFNQDVVIKFAIEKLVF